MIPPPIALHFLCRFYLRLVLSIIIHPLNVRLGLRTRYISTLCVFASRLLFKSKGLSPIYTNSHTQGFFT